MKWEYTFYCAFDDMQEPISIKEISSSLLWNGKIRTDGLTPAEIVREFGKQEWELVAITPISLSTEFPGITDELLFTFKRPISE